MVTTCRLLYYNKTLSAPSMTVIKCQNIHLIIYSLTNLSIDISKEQALSCATYKCPSCVEAMKDELLYDEGETLVNTSLTYM